MTTSPTKCVIDELKRLPQLPLVVEELREVLAAERQRRQEFYATMKESDKVEFINGQIVYQSPVKLRHSNASEHVFILLKTFVHVRSLGHVGHKKLLISLTRNDYEPDIAFWGQAVAVQFAPDQMRFPAPDLVVEVLSPSTEEVDRDTKFKDYEAHGVEEYWLIDPETETVEQFVLRDGQYTLQMKSATGTLASVVVQGFVIPVRAIFDEAENFAALGQIVG